jgi:hypothetical protein
MDDPSGLKGSGAPRSRRKPMSKLPIRQFLDISTDHLSRAANEVLENGGVGDAILIVTPTDHGYFVHALSNEDEVLSQSGVPQDLIDLLEFASANGCDFILFDTDAPVISGLPTFEK